MKRVTFKIYFEPSEDPTGPTGGIFEPRRLEPVILLTPDCPQPIDSGPLELDFKDSDPQEPDLSDTSPQEPDLSDTSPQEPDLSDTSPQEPDLSDTSPQEPDLSDTSPQEPDLSDTSPQEPDLSDTSPQEPDISDSGPQEPGFRDSGQVEPHCRVSFPYPNFMYLTSGIDPKTRGLIRQYLVATAVSIAVIMTGNAMGWPSPTLPLLTSPESPVPMTTDDTSWMVSLMYFGNLFSPIPCGYLMELIGRKYTLLALSVFPFTSWLLILFTRSVTMIFIARFLSGLWLGIVYTVVPIYLGEIAEPSIRGSLSTFFAIMTYVGVLFEYAVGPYVSYSVLAGLSFVFSLVFCLVFSPMPETPYYFVKKNKMEQARASLFWLRGNDPNVDVELKSIEDAVRKQMENKGTMKDLFFHPGNRKAFLIVGVLSILQRLSGIGAMIAYTSVTLPKNALGPIGRNECVIILGTVWVLSTLLSSFMVDKVGRKVLLVISSLGCALATFVAGLWFFLNDNMEVDVIFINWIPFVCFVLHGFFYSIGLNPIVTTIKGEVFSSNVKGVASAVTTIMLALASTFLNKSYQMFADSIGMFFNYWMYAAGCILAIIFTLAYVVETKGKTLQEIQDKLNGIKKKENEIIVSKL